MHKGFIDDKLRPGLEAQPVAVKLLDLDGSQGHKEWLVSTPFHLMQKVDNFILQVLFFFFLHFIKTLKQHLTTWTRINNVILTWFDFFY